LKGEEMSDGTGYRSKADFDYVFESDEPGQETDYTDFDIAFEVACLKKALRRTIDGASGDTEERYSNYRTVIEAWEVNRNTPYPDLDPAFLNVPGIHEALGNDSVLKQQLLKKISRPTPPQHTEQQDAIGNGHSSNGDRKTSHTMKEIIKTMGGNVSSSKVRRMDETLRPGFLQRGGGVTIWGYDDDLEEALKRWTEHSKRKKAEKKRTKNSKITTCNHDT